MTDKLDFAATHRNKVAIFQVLQQHLRKGNIIEIASGSGQHIIHFAQAMPQHTFWPTDPDQNHLASIAAWSDEAGLKNIKPPVKIGTTDKSWIKGSNITGLPQQTVAIICINMIHIAPIEAALGLFVGAKARLKANGVLYLYGPFFGVSNIEAKSNIAFDLDLKRRNSAWGIRHVDQITKIAQASGFELIKLVQMPANNCSALFVRS